MVDHAQQSFFFLSFLSWSRIDESSPRSGSQRLILDQKKREKRIGTYTISFSMTRTALNAPRSGNQKLVLVIRKKEIVRNLSVGTDASWCACIQSLTAPRLRPHISFSFIRDIVRPGEVTVTTGVDSPGTRTIS